MYVLYEDDMKVPCKIWSEKGSIEDSCIQQLKNISSLPFAFHHTVLNPDGHCGYGMPIGGVLATTDVVIPNAVGVDIGCGVVAAKLSINKDMVGKNELIIISDYIKKVVPVGFNKHPSGVHNLNEINCLNNLSFSLSDNIPNAVNSLGTLGGGNHFIEIQRDDNGGLWIMIHSGSRNLGKVVAEYYNKMAIDYNKMYYSSVPSSYDLAFLSLRDGEGENYLRDMNVCVEFAKINRAIMLSEVFDVINERFDWKVEITKLINIHHNYAALENHFGEDVIVHRKGATSANLGELGIIPGSQGTSSYIVEGLGNPDSFKSCSHGAGRVLSRSRAKKELDLQKQIDILEDRGIIHSMKDESSLDEAPGAYKDIDVVMENQKDLVKVVYKLNPLAVIKG